MSMAQDATASASGSHTENGTVATGASRPSVTSPPMKPLLRASTSLEGPRQNPTLRPRRSSSFISDFSNHSLRGSTDNLLLPNVRDQDKYYPEEPSHWQSAPLAFAILPALGGLFFQNGSLFVTDICLLILAAIFLNWSVRLPWEWYHSAQQTRTVESPLEPTDTILEDVEEESLDEDSAPLPEATSSNGSPLDIKTKRRDTAMVGAEQLQQATTELQVHEVLALASCFVGPALGTYLLHAIRSQLSRPSEGLISDFNLSIFFLAAELRPLAHLIKMMRARTLYLQRVVAQHSKAVEPTDMEQVQDLGKRVGEMETRVADIVSGGIQAQTNKGPEAAEIAKDINKAVQPQLDALNRAVRRYEKRYTTQTMLTEARLQDLEGRLKDALSLAATAARSSQKPGIVAIMLQWLSQVFMLPFQVFHAVVMLPVQAVADVLAFVKSLFVPPKHPKGKSARGKSERSDHYTTASRVQSRSRPRN